MGSPERVTWQEVALEQAQSRLDGFQRRAAAALGAPTQDPLRETRNPGRSFPNIIRSVPQHRESPYAPNLLNLQE